MHVLEVLRDDPYTLVHAETAPETTNSQMGGAADLRFAYDYDRPNPVVEHRVDQWESLHLLAMGYGCVRVP